MSNDSANTSDSETDAEETPEENEEDLDTTEEDDAAETAPVAEGGFVSGALAFVSAALGLVSLTGTSIADKLHARREIIGQIDSSSGADVDQMELFYGAPWSTVAFTNGAFGLLAMLLGGGVLLVLWGLSVDTRPWVKALALGGVILGGIGLLIAVGMNLDLFADQPVIPTAPTGG
ncbi:hypothetical protein [Glycomyces xiaoerkulensis]|uniref:hypothetical protein n=1 Tax=Glycomyces xiaoerkulensis TaxID=2038139 RepID=UPI000C262507|nr:hypothetical protein [Glycomyces xiaoerkulensis]